MTAFASADILPQLMDLWKTVFADTDRYIGLFFKHQYRPEETLIDVENGAVRAMVFFPRYRLRISGEEFSAGYICGAATRPEHRSKGIMSALLERAHAEMARRGDEFSLLIPANGSLYSYYARFGYTPFFMRGKSERNADALSHKNKDISLYAADSDTLLTLYDALSARWPCAVIQDKRRLLTLLRFYSGNGGEENGAAYIISRSGAASGWMFCSYDSGIPGGRWVVSELAGSVDADSAAAALAGIRPAAQVRVEGPFYGEPKFDTVRDAGMLKPLTAPGHIKPPRGYMNMMLD